MAAAARVTPIRELKLQDDIELVELGDGVGEDEQLEALKAKINRLLDGSIGEYWEIIAQPGRYFSEMNGLAYALSTKMSVKDIATNLLRDPAFKGKIKDFLNGWVLWPLIKFTVKEKMEIEFPFEQLMGSMTNIDILMQLSDSLGLKHSDVINTQDIGKIFDIFVERLKTI